MQSAIFQLKRLTTRLALALGFTAGLYASTVTYDLTSDWSNSANPNGVWSYDQGSTPLPFQSNLGIGSCFGGAAGVTGGYAPGIDFGNAPPCLPAMFQATGNAANTEDYLTGDIVVHAQDPSNGAGQGQATIVWTAPATGTITFTGAVWYAHSTVVRSEDFILSHGADTLAGGTVAFDPTYTTVGSGRTNPGDFSSSNSIAVNAGDQVDLVIQRTPGSEGGLTGVQLAITETTSDVPEPSTAALSLGLFVAAAGWRTMRARRQAGLEVSSNSRRRSAGEEKAVGSPA
jgi:hypothetical protein